MEILVLQHIACEPPGAYEEVLLEQEAGIHRVELDQGHPIPDWRGFDGIMAMGGPMSANDDVALSWLKEEKAVIAEAVRAGVPYWGVCLGGQLLAASLGARVYRGPKPEVGLLPVYLTGEAMGDQFHLEVSAEMAREWAGVPAYASDLERVLGPGSLPRLVERLDQSAGMLNAEGRKMFRRWLELISAWKGEGAR